MDNQPNEHDFADQDHLLDHAYDGIQEYDNPLPGWWKWLFIASIIFTPPYFFFYHNGTEGRSMADRYDRNLAANLRWRHSSGGQESGGEDARQPQGVIAEKQPIA